MTARHRAQVRLNVEGLRDRRLTESALNGLRADNERAKRAGWRADIGVDDVDMLLDAVRGVLDVEIEATR